MNDTDQAQILRRVRLALQERDYQTAIQNLKQAADIAHVAGDKGAEGRHLGNLALIYYRLQQPDKALVHFQRALEKAREEHDKLTEDGLLGNMGNILRELGRYDEAISHLSQALIIANEIGDVRGRGLWLGNLGLVYDDMKQPQRAIELHEQSIVIARQLQDKRGLASRLGNLGNSYIAAGDYVSAVKYFEGAITIFEELGDQEGLALRLGILGNIYNELGRTTPNPQQDQQYLKTALEHYERALGIARELGDQASEAGLLHGIGNALGNLGEFDRAIDSFQAAYRMFSDLGHDERCAHIQRSIEQAAAYRDQQTSGEKT